MAGKKYGGRRAAAFIFDLDGTLIDSGRDIAQAANHARGHFRLPDIPFEVAVSYIGDGVAMLMRRTLGYDAATGATGESGLPVGEEQLAEGLAVFADHYERHCLDTTRLYPGVLDVLLRFQRYPLMVATSKPARFTHKILAGLHVAPAFRRVVCGDEVTHKKPHPEVLQRCAEGLDVPPDEVVVVGDSPNDVAAARAYGAISVAAAYGLTAPGLLKSARADHLIASIAELADLFPSR